jgi:serine phosphatase RsbU (regulator of sigma subunit)/GAF domain-containing protein
MTRHEKIINIMNKITTSDNFNALMSAIIDSAKEILNAEGASLLLLDRETDELIFDVVVSSKGEIIQGKRIKKGMGIAGTVSDSGLPLAVNDVSSDPRFFSDIDKASGFVTRSIAAVPVVMRDRQLGVLEVVNSRSPSGFSDDDLRLLSYMADASAVSIHNQELLKSLRNRVDELTCIYEISQSIYFSMDIDSLLQRVLSAIQRVIKAQRCSFVIVDDKTKRAKHFASTSGQIPIEDVNLEDGLIAHVLRTGDPLLVYNLDEMKLYSKGVDTSRYASKSFICIPMMLRDRVVGVLNVTDKPHSEIFDSFDLRVLSTITQQVAEMYENVSLQSVEMERRRIDRDLSIAAEIQMRGMPAIPMDVEGISVDAFIHPARYVGGDFYEFSEPDDRFFLAGIADISGKGIPAAMFMSSVRNALRMAALKSRDLEQVFRRANDQIYLDSFSGMFCTCFYMMIDRQSRTFSYTSAGHNPQLFYKAATDTFVELVRSGKALGIVEGSECPARTISYAPGDIAILFTDGVFEQGAECELSMEDIHSLVREHRSEGASSLCAAIHSIIKVNAAKREPVDDSTLAVIFFK